MTVLIELASVPDSALYVDTRPASDYERGHLPGAIHLDTFDLDGESTDGPGMDALLAEWRRVFASSGIAWGDTVVFYDTATENRSSRPAVALHGLGHPRSHVLHGGAAAWLDDGRAMTTRAVVRHVATWPDAPPIRPETLIGIDEVASFIGRDDVVLLDVRDRAEFDGIRPMQDNPRLGRIPGGRSLEWSSLLRTRTDYPELAGTPRSQGYVLDRFLDDGEIRGRLAGHGAGSDDARIVVYCQRSHRASNTFIALENLGYRHVGVFAGSFREWSRRLDLPVEA